MKTNKAAVSAWIMAGCIVGCGEDRAAKSAFPGELGAPCQTPADCDNGALCTAQLSDNPYQLKYCYVPCGEDDACPTNSFCTEEGFRHLDSTLEQTLRLCSRRCVDDDSCAQLHPDANKCSSWDQPQVRPEDKYCGIRN